VINFAQGEFIMLGGMLAVFTQAGLPCRPRWRWPSWCRPWSAC
jgi:branched-subunit amino acid ABC-type transport system permease component